MSQALQIYEGGGFELMQRAAAAMVQSGYFKDSKDVAQAVVKVMAGAELGISPFASMAGIHIVNGKPTLSSNLIATLVKNDPRYDFHPVETTDKVCQIAWYENGEERGYSSFTIQEANAAMYYNNKRGQWEALSSKPVWKSFTSDMLFARALTRGARRYAPGIFGGAPVYTPEEVGADVDEDGVIVDVTPSRQNPTWQVHDMPYEDDGLAAMQAQKDDDGLDDNPITAEDIQDATPAQVNPGKTAQVVKPAETVEDDPIRASLAKNPRPTIGTVTTAAFNGDPYYKSHMHAFNAVKSEYQFPNGVDVKKIKQDNKLKPDTALAMYDWLKDRAGRKLAEEVVEP